MQSTDPNLVGHTVAETIVDGDGKTIMNDGKIVSKGLLTRMSKIPERTLSVRAFVSSDPSDIVYLSADEEENLHVAQATSPLSEVGEFTDDRIETRIGEGVAMESPHRAQYMDVSPMQLVSVSTALIPFLEHDDANRALMGSNMQRQAVPLLRPEPPLVGTGMERRVARDSGQVLTSKTEGVVTEASGTLIVITDDGGKETIHKLKKFIRSNQGTCINQRSIVTKGDRVQVGDILADSSSTPTASSLSGRTCWWRS